MASKKKILEHNSRTFLSEIDNVSEIVTYIDETGGYFTLKKCQVLELAERKEIQCYITTHVYENGRKVMVLL